MFHTNNQYLIPAAAFLFGIVATIVYSQFCGSTYVPCFCAKCSDGAAPAAFLGVIGESDTQTPLAFAATVLSVAVLSFVLYYAYLLMTPVGRFQIQQDLGKFRKTFQ